MSFYPRHAGSAPHKDRLEATPSPEQLEIFGRRAVGNLGAGERRKLKAALEKEPLDRQAWRHLKEHRYAEAETTFCECLAKEPREPSGQFFSLHWGFVQALVSQGKVKEAAGVAKAALQRFRIFTRLTHWQQTVEVLRAMNDPELQLFETMTIERQEELLD